jgi:hypothetical protein
MLGVGLMWGALGGAVGLVVGVVGAAVDQGTISEWLTSVGLGFAGFGFLAGVGFAATLSALDGRRTLRELSVRRAAALGGLAGFAFPLTLVAALSGGALPLVPAILTAAAFGGVTALLGAASVHFARSRARLEPADDDLLPPSVYVGR